MRSTKITMEIKITHKGEDYIAVEVDGNEKELHVHDGEAIKHLLSAIRAIFRAYS